MCRMSATAIVDRATISGVGRTVEDRRVHRQALADPAGAFAHPVVSGPDQVELAELGQGLQHQVVAVRLLDLRHQRQQQLLGRRLVGGQGQVAGPLQLTGDRHGCIISRTRARREAADVQCTSAARGATDQLQDTLISNFFVIMPAIGFFMSAPAASPVMV